MTSPPANSSSVLLLTASLLLGVLTGILTGLGLSSDISPALTLLATVAGGASGFLVVRASSRAATSPPEPEVYAGCVIALVLGVLGGLATGFWVDSRRAPWSVVGDKDAQLIPAGARNEEAADWLLLDAHLTVLGLAPDERKAFFKAMRPETRGWGAPKLTESLKELCPQLKELLPTKKDVDKPEDWKAVATSLDAVSNWIEEHPDRALFRAERLVQTLVGKLSGLRDGKKDKAYISSRPEVQKAAQDVEHLVDRLVIAVDLSRSPVEAVNRRIKAFLEANEKAKTLSLLHKERARRVYARD